ASEGEYGNLTGNWGLFFRLDEDKMYWSRISLTLRSIGKNKWQGEAATETNPEAQDSEGKDGVINTTFEALMLPSIEGTITVTATGPGRCTIHIRRLITMGTEKGKVAQGDIMGTFTTSQLLFEWRPGKSTTLKRQ
ncbi:MAG: hypothetical protein ABIO36_09305, partial [Pyrinomonadaceae bacterium]